ncbi:papain-like cysteine protease family protein [Agarilytica rhodophyticola]|uniref:papain-like cysteine protease family protein n=1 Tax=Agarilytica rhodophyticola TaxID=1737490 RepID=UPI001319CCC2|nr:papain-like cysteine protease family protein [Agarilytica rhodophyticola]
MSVSLPTTPGGPFIGGFRIPIRHLKQKHDNDCWATCLAMIFRWRGVAITSDEIFTRAPEFIPGGYQYGQQATNAEANRVAKKLTDGAISFSPIDNPKSKNADYWMQHLNKYKPVLTSINNHARVLVGYNGAGQLLILDPDPRKDSNQQPEIIGIGVMQRLLMSAWVMD